MLSKLKGIVFSDGIKYGSTFDHPDSRDFRAEEMFGTVNEDNIPEEVDLLVGTNYRAKNQGKSVKCTSYATTSVFEVMNRTEHKQDVTFNPNDIWFYMVKHGMTTKNGASLQSALKVLVKNGLFWNDKKYLATGYARVEKTYESYKNFIAQGFPIYTGMNVTRTNFEKAKKDGVWGGLDGTRVTGHAVFIVGYGRNSQDKEGLLAMNSYGDWGKYEDGTFWVLKEDVKDLFSGYIIYDKVDAKRLYADVTDNDWAYKDIDFLSKKGIMTGEKKYPDQPQHERSFYPNRPITRRELAVVIARVMRKLRGE